MHGAGLLLQREEWQDAWLAHEAGEAQATAEEALEAAGAWEPAPSALLMDADDDAVFGVRVGQRSAAGRPAWQVITAMTFAWASSPSCLLNFTVPGDSLDCSLARQMHLQHEVRNPS